jgi:hypothetical protein
MKTLYWIFLENLRYFSFVSSLSRLLRCVARFLFRASRKEKKLVKSGETEKDFFRVDCDEREKLYV